MNVATEMPLPFVFTDSAAGKVKELIEKKAIRTEAARVCHGWRLLGFPVRLYL
jgi:hypothetical protein